MEEWAAYGIVEPDEDGIYAEYRTPPMPSPAVHEEGTAVTSWLDVFVEWPTVAADLAATYGDAPYTVEDWRDLRGMILGLMSRPDRSAFAAARLREQQKQQTD